MKTFFTSFALIMLFFISVASFSFAQTNWKRHAENPVLTTGAQGEWDDSFIQHSSVVFDGNEYHMYYCGRRTARRPYWIGHATSPDGLSWQKDTLNNPVLSGGPVGSWDENYAFSPCVIYNDTIFHMWYTGVNQTNQIGYAWSSDGVIWQKYDDPKTTNILYAESDPVLTPGAGGSWDNAFVEVPAVIMEGNTFTMWYLGASNFSIEGIGRATSTDGIHWTKNPSNEPVLEPGSSSTWENGFIRLGSVVFYDTTYHLFYYGGSFYNKFQIGYAWSSDGVIWQKYDDSTTTNILYAKTDPVLIPDKPGWEESIVWAPWVMLDTLNNKFKMWYSGMKFASDTTGGIGYATISVDSFIVYIINDIKDINFTRQPGGFNLRQNYPNPFNPSTTIEFILPKSEYVELKVYNILGKEVTTIVSRKLNQGNHTYTLDGINLASGIYYYQLVAGEHRAVKKMILLR